MGSLLLSPGSWCTQGFVCALQEFASPVLCKFWRLCGGVSGKLLQEGLCHTQVCCTQSSDPTADSHLHRRHPNTQRQVWLSLCGVSWCTEGFVCALQESVSPVLCKFWRLYGGVNGDHLQEGLCHTQVCCTQSLCPYSSPLLTHTSIGDTQTPFCLCLCGVSGSWCTQGSISLEA